MDPRWLTSEDIGLTGDLDLEWGLYTKLLYEAGIVLSLDSDQLIWAANKQTGAMTAQIVYLSVLKLCQAPVD